MCVKYIEFQSRTAKSMLYLNYTYVQKSYVVFEGGANELFMLEVAGDFTILLQATDILQIMLTSDDAENGDIGDSEKTI